MEKLLDRTPFCRVHEHVDTDWWRTTTDFLSFPSIIGRKLRHFTRFRPREEDEGKSGTEISKRLIIERTKEWGGEGGGEAKLKEEGEERERERERGN